MSKQRFVTTAVVAGAVALAAAAFAVAATSRHASSGATVKPTPAALAAARDRVEQWLGSVGLKGFHVSEVMAFTNNDYIAVNDKQGKPAFELLMAPDRSWLIEEQVSMMWNTRYGMMGGSGESGNGPYGGMMGGYGMMGGGMMGGWSSWYGSGSARVTSIGQAIKIAGRWLAEARSGEKAEQHGSAFPGYFTIDTTRGGKIAGMLSVNASTGAVWYHGWHGSFLSEREFTP